MADATPDRKSNHFTIIPDSIMERSDILPAAKLLFGVIRGFCLAKGGEGYCVGSNSYLAKRIGLTPDHVSELIRQLCKADLIRRSVSKDEGNRRYLHLTTIGLQADSYRARTLEGIGLQTDSSPSTALDPIGLQPEHNISLDKKKKNKSKESFSLRFFKEQNMLPLESVTLADIREHYTIETLAKHVSRPDGIPSNESPAETAKRHGLVPLLIEISHRFNNANSEQQLSMNDWRREMFAHILAHERVPLPPPKPP